MMRFFFILAFAIFANVSFPRDILTLTNQNVFEGKVLKIENCNIVFKVNHQKYIVPSSDIYSIQFGNVNDKVYSDYIDFMHSTDNDGDNLCLDGRLDAENYHGKKGGHFFLGVLFGPFAMIGTALANPTPEKGAKTFLLSKNKEEFANPEYLSCYKKKAKGQLIGMEALGWGAWILLVLVAGGL